MTNVKITGPDALTLPAALGGDTLDAVRVKQGGIVISLGGGTTRVEGLTRVGISLADIVTMVGAGAEIEGFEVWFELANSSFISTPHPLAPIVDEDGFSITPENWQTYGVVGNSHAVVGPYAGGKYYRSSAMGVSGEPLLGSLIAPLITGPNAWGSVITVEQFIAIQEA